MVDTRQIRKVALFKLFDALVLPVAAYGCQVWLPSTLLFKTLTSESPSTHESCKTIAKDPLENLHLSFLKWTLGVSKTTSNASIWGDCGRVPQGITMSKQLFAYKERLEQMDVVDGESLVRHAYQEQKLSNLSWFKCVDKLATSTLANTFGPRHRVNPTPRPSQIRTNLTKWFIETWELSRAANRKLSFYNNIKSSFGVELYLTLKLNNTESKRIAQLRTSSHQFKP